MALTGSFLDATELAARTIAPTSLVTGDFIDSTGQFTDPAKVAKRTAWQTFVDSQLVIATSRVVARLRKRYDVAQLVAPYPEIVLGWIVAEVTPKLYKRRGWDPSDAQSVDVLEDAQQALTEQKEAADSNDGLYELPLRQDLQTSAVSQGGPFGYAEQSPYTASDLQRCAAEQEEPF